MDELEETEQIEDSANSFDLGVSGREISYIIGSDGTDYRLFVTETRSFLEVPFEDYTVIEGSLLLITTVIWLSLLIWFIKWCFRWMKL